MIPLPKNSKYVQRVTVRLVREPGNPPLTEARRIRQTEDAFRIFRAHYPEDLAREQFSVLALNTRNKPLSHEVLSTGSLNGSLVHPREVFLHAILQNAAAIVVAHNHPSGDPNPSREDRQLTRRLAEAGRILGIDLLDHIILSHGPHFYSFKEQGEI